MGAFLAVASAGKLGTTQKEKAGARPAFRIRYASSRRSVLPDDRATPAVVDARSDDIDVLADPLRGEEGAGRVDEGLGAVLHEQVIVLDAGGPVGGEAELEARADRATPAGVVAGGGNQE